MIRKYKTTGDFLDEVLDGMWDKGMLDYLSPKRSSLSFKGTWVDTDKFDIVPKKGYFDEEIARKSEQIDALKREFESYKTHYDIRIKKLEEEREALEVEKNKKWKAIDKDG